MVSAEERRLARAQSAFLLIGQVLGWLTAIAILIRADEDVRYFNLVADVVVSALLLVSYLISRTRYYRVATVTAVIPLIAFVQAQAFQPGVVQFEIGLFQFGFAVISAMFLPIWFTVVFAVSSLAVQFYKLQGSEALGEHSAGEPTIFMALLLALTLAAAFFRRYTEDSRRRDLESSLERSHAVLDSVFDGVALLDDDWNIVDVNTRFLELFKTTVEQTVGQNLSRFLVEGSDPDDVTSDLPHELVGLTSSGERITLSATGRPLHLEGRPRTLFVIRDVSAEKEAAQAKSLSERLEGLGLMAGGVAHDFNNLLTVIGGNLNLLRAKKSTVFLDRAESATRRAQELTKQLFNFSKGEALDHRPSSVADLARETTVLAIDESKIKVHIDVPDDLPKVKVGPGQLHQVLFNLLVNSGEAMAGQSGATIDLKATREDRVPPVLPPGEYVHLTVADNGPGIERKLLDSIFDPHFSTKSRGSGLGLATSYRIIKRHGGFISVDSYVGQGTTFHLYLPIARHSAIVTSLPSRDNKVSGLVMVCDQDSGFRRVLCGYLHSMGFETVDAGSSTSSALASCRELVGAGQQVSAFVMNVNGSDSPGAAEAVELIRNVDPAIHTIATSADEDHPVVRNYAKYGFRSVLFKPFSRQQLEECFQSVAAGEGERMPEEDKLARVAYLKN